jgi:hypothetical protein
MSIPKTYPTLSAIPILAVLAAVLATAARAQTCGSQAGDATWTWRMSLEDGLEAAAGDHHQSYESVPLRIGIKLLYTCLLVYALAAKSIQVSHTLFVPQKKA